MKSGNIIQRDWNLIAKGTRKTREKWSLSQKQRAEILFSQYPDLEKAHSLSNNDILNYFDQRSTNAFAKSSMPK